MPPNGLEEANGSGDNVNRISVDLEAKQYVLAIDVGTTNIRAHVYDKKAKIVGQATQQVELVYPSQGRVEIEPEHLWTAFLNVCRTAIKGSFICTYD